jgi:CRISPR-associated protein Cas2
MWLIVMFDLPTVTNQEKRAAHKFRMGLLDVGFNMMQYSVYIRSLPGKESAEKYKKMLNPAVPIGGRVQFLMISDAQFENIETYYGATKQAPMKAQEQLLLF